MSTVPSSKGVKVHFARELTAYDYEYDDPLFPPKSVNEPTDYHKKLVNIYCAVCSKLNIIPVSHIQKNLTDSKIKIRSRGIGPKGIKAVAVTLVKNNTVEHLDVSDNDIGSEGVRSLSQMLEENSSITHLDLSENKIGAAGIEAICKVIARQDILKTLRLCGVGCQNKEILYIKNMLDQNMHLKELHLAQNEISLDGCLLLKKAISDNDTLEYLDLSWNHIRGKGATAVAEGLGENRGLKHLNISWNGFAMDGSNALAKALIKNKTLNKLNVSSNRIHKEAMALLLIGLKKNTALSILILKGNQLTPAATLVLLTEIANMKQSNLREIDISDIAIPEEFLSIMMELQETRSIVVKHGPLLTHSSTSKGVEPVDEEDIPPMEPTDLLFNVINMDGLRIAELFKLNHFKSSSVTKEAFKAGLMNANIRMTELQLEGLINVMETDKNGKIDLVKLIEAQREQDKKIVIQSKH